MSRPRRAGVGDGAAREAEAAAAHVTVPEPRVLKATLAGGAGIVDGQLVGIDALEEALASAAGIVDDRLGDAVAHEGTGQGSWSSKRSARQW